MPGAIAHQSVLIAARGEVHPAVAETGVNADLEGRRRSGFNVQFQCAARICSHIAIVGLDAQAVPGTGVGAVRHHVAAFEWGLRNRGEVVPYVQLGILAEGQPRTGIALLGEYTEAPRRRGMLRADIQLCAGV